MLAFHQTHQFVGNAIHHDQHFFVGADNVVIKRCTFNDGLRGAYQIGGFINHHRRVTRTSRNQAFIGVFTRSINHRFATGNDQQANTWVLEQTLSGFDIRIGNGNQQVCRATSGNNRLVKQSYSALRNAFCRRMWRKYHAVACGNQADGIINYGCCRVGGRCYRSHHAPRRVFNQR